MNLPMNLTPLFGLLTGGGPWLGKAAMIGVFVLLLIWLAWMPKRLIGDEAAAPWWRRARVWAILITCLQIAVYVVLG